MSVYKQRGWWLYALVELVASIAVARWALRFGGDSFDALNAVLLLHVLIPHRRVYVMQPEVGEP